MKRIVRLFCDIFELEDHEYIRGEFGKWPLKFWFTILEPRYRRGWKNLMPWRLRCTIASIVRKRVWGHCTRCNSPFTFKELLNRNSGLIHHLSGSVCHRDCKPSPEFIAMCERLKMSYEGAKRA